MLIKSLEYKNFRQFKGENKIEFSCDPGKNVTIILGDNTYGKTTLLQMFNWCFYDKAMFNDNPKFLLNLELAANMDNGENEKVKVVIVLTHEGREYTINREQIYTKDRNKVTPDDSKLKVSYKDLDSGKSIIVNSDNDMRSIINLIMPEDLSGYFFFDTERVQNVAERKDLSEAVKGLLGLTVLDNALKHLGKEESKTTVIGSFYEDLKKNDDSKASEALAEIQDAEECSENQQTIIDDAENDIDTYESRREILEDKIRDLRETTNYQLEKDNLQQKIDMDKHTLEDLYGKYASEFGSRSVWFFAQPLYKQSTEFITKADISDKGVSDVTINTIKELIKNGRCLCGAEVKEGNEAYKHLVEQIKYVPPESIGTTIRNFKKDVKFHDTINNTFYNDIETKVGEIMRYKKRIADWEDEVEQLEKKIEGKENAKDYQLELNDVKGKIKERTGTKESAIANKAKADARKDRFKKIYDALILKSDKSKEILSYFSYATEVRNWIQDYYNTEESKIRGELEKHVNEIFQRMYNGERVLEINEKYQTVLYAVIPETGEKVISGESEGLIRVKNFAFIAGLVDLAKGKALSVGEDTINNEPYPLILDAPFSNADEKHIKSISIELPEVAEQVIMFVMKKDWSFAETVIANRVNKTYVLEKHSDIYSTIS